MAIHVDCLRFIALPSVHTVITNIWNGEIESKAGFKAFIKVNYYESNQNKNFLIFFKSLILIFKLFLSICTFGFLAPVLINIVKDSIIVFDVNVFIMFIIVLKL